MYAELLSLDQYEKGGNLEEITLPAIANIIKETKIGYVLDAV